MTEYVEKGAMVSACGKYRYELWREWRGTHDRKNWRWYGTKDGAGAEMGTPKSCLFIMLNPSTADGEKDDATIRRCVGFAKSWNYERLEVVNLFAFRTRYPKELLVLHHDADPVGHLNQERVEMAANDAGMIVCAWGTNGNHIGQDETVLGWVDRHINKVYALGLTKDGQPRHPLYLPSASKPFAFGRL